MHTVCLCLCYPMSWYIHVVNLLHPGVLAPVPSGCTSGWEAAVQSCLFLSQTTNLINFRESGNPSNKQICTWLTPAVTEERYFEVALKFLWSSQELLKITTMHSRTWSGEKMSGRKSGREDEACMGMENMTLKIQCLKNNLILIILHEVLTHRHWLALPSGSFFFYNGVQWN